MKFFKNIILVFFFSILISNSGSIVGTVIDSDTHQPIIGANIIVLPLEIGANTDENGEFFIQKIPVGSYSVLASIIGYEKITKVNIDIFSDKQTPIKFLLNPSFLKNKEVLVKAGYFEKSKDAVVSSQTIDRAEIRSDPIGVYDVQMMTHSLPSVVTDTDQNNEIIVRGGGPGENLFIMDHLEIPNPNHFGFVGTGGGPVNLINTEFVERIDFYAGGYPSRYGDKSSSVMDISLRDGNFLNAEYDVEMSMAGLGLLVEGPILKNKISYIGSYRKSFIDDLIESAGLTSVPKYSNMQHKLTFNINPANKIMFNFLGGEDNISIVDENRPDLYGAENVDYEGYQYTYGVTYKSLFSKKGYFLMSLGNSTTSWEAEVFKFRQDTLSNTENVLIQDVFFERDNIESDKFFKFDLVYKIKNNLELSSGINIKKGNYRFNEIFSPDPISFYSYPLLPDSVVDSLVYFSDYNDFLNVYPQYENEINNYVVTSSEPFPGFVNKQNGALWKYFAYSQFKLKFKLLEITGGVRYDYIKVNNTSEISPRFGISYKLNPVTKFNFAFGKYYQTPNYWKLLSPDNTRDLENSYTEQFIIGLEHFIDDDIRLTFEIYNKNIFKRSILKTDITANPLDDFDGSFEFLSIGEGYSNGVEIFIQKKFSYNWHGTFSYSFSDSKAKDYRENKSGYYPWDFDSRNSLTLVGGYKYSFRDQDWYEKYRNSKLFYFLSWIPFMPSDQFEISFRIRYSDGLPFTPRKFDFNTRLWLVDDELEINRLRENYYARFDIMFLRKFSFDKFNLTTFIDLQNIFNRNNEWERVYYDDGTYEMSYQYKLVPVGGFIIEF